MSGRGGNGSGNQACAACKYQRRKCFPDCTLAPFFPPDQQKQFLNAHKLFGVNKILRIIHDLDPIQKWEAMKTIKYQAEVRARDPVGGCHRIILDLKQQLERDSIELEFVRQQLAICRSQVGDNTQQFQHSDHVELSMNPNFTSGHSAMQQQQQQQHYNQLQYFDGCLEHNRNPEMLMIQDINRNEIGQSSSSSNLDAASPLLIECQDTKPMNGLFDGIQTLFLDDAKKSFENSSKDVQKEDSNSVKIVEENDLRGAASLFTLTNSHQM